MYVSSVCPEAAASDRSPTGCYCLRKINSNDNQFSDPEGSRMQLATVPHQSRFSARKLQDQYSTSKAPIRYTNSMNLYWSCDFTVLCDFRGLAPNRYVLYWCCPRVALCSYGDFHGVLWYSIVRAPCRYHSGIALLRCCSCFVVPRWSCAGIGVVLVGSCTTPILA